MPRPSGWRTRTDRRSEPWSGWRRSCSVSSIPTSSSRSGQTGSPDIQTTWPSEQRSPRRASRCDRRHRSGSSTATCRGTGCCSATAWPIGWWSCRTASRAHGTSPGRYQSSLARQRRSGMRPISSTLEWFPSGSYLIEQGEAATTMYFLLSGHVEIRREGEDGHVQLVDRSGPGEFIGEQGIATGRPRNAHVVSVDDVTTLTFSATGPRPPQASGRPPAAPDQIAPVGGSDRRCCEHGHRRLRLRRSQDARGCRASLAVPDRSDDLPRSDPPRDVRRRVLPSGLARSKSSTPHSLPRRSEDAIGGADVGATARLRRRRRATLRSTAPCGQAGSWPRGARGRVSRRVAGRRRC